MTSNVATMYALLFLIAFGSPIFCAVSTYGSSEVYFIINTICIIYFPQDGKFERLRKIIWKFVQLSSINVPIIN